MKHIQEYIDGKIIDENLISWMKGYIKKLRANQNKLIAGNKVNMIKMDVDKLKFQQEPAKLSDLSKEKDIIDIWSSKKTGFPVSADVLRNSKKYCVDLGDTKSDPYVYTFYYNSENTYYAGVIIYENAIRYIENYLHIISIETNLVVDNPSDVQTAIFDQFKQLTEKNYDGILGFTAKIVNPKMKGVLNNLRFVKSDDNEEIYKYDI